MLCLLLTLPYLTLPHHHHSKVVSLSLQLTKSTYVCIAGADAASLLIPTPAKNPNVRRTPASAAHHIASYRIFENTRWLLLSTVPLPSTSPSPQTKSPSKLRLLHAKDRPRSLTCATCPVLSPSFCPEYLLTLLTLAYVTFCKHLFFFFVQFF